MREVTSSLITDEDFDHLLEWTVCEGNEGVFRNFLMRCHDSPTLPPTSSHGNEFFHKMLRYREYTLTIYSLAFANESVAFATYQFRKPSKLFSFRDSTKSLIQRFHHNLRKHYNGQKIHNGDFHFGSRKWYMVSP